MARTKTTATAKRARVSRASPQPTATELAAGAVLEQRVRETPDDADARSVYADWLEQHGQLATAAFIRSGGVLVTPEGAEQLLDTVLVALRARNQQPGRVYGTRGIDLAEHDETRPILESPQRALWLRATIARIVDVQTLYLARGSGVPAYLGDGYDTRPFSDAHAYLRLIASHVLRGKPVLSEADIVYLLDVMSRGESLPGLRHVLPWPGLTGAVERYVQANGLVPAVRTAIDGVLTNFLRKQGVVFGKDDLQIRKRLEALLD
jgi:uncharacterized protein (TIGR02996 family)